MSVSRFEPQGLRSAKVTTNLKFYLQKYLVLDKKQIKYSQLLQEKSIFVSSRKQPKEITMKKFKTKAIQAYGGIFTHILTYSDIFKHKQSIGIFRNLCNPGIFRTLVGIYRTKTYSEPWYIENRGIFRTLVYSEPWHIQNPVKHLLWSVFAKIVNDYNYFHNISFSSFLLYEKILFF